MKITLSMVSHGQQDIALRMLRDLARLRPPEATRPHRTGSLRESDRQPP